MGHIWVDSTLSVFSLPTDLTLEEVDELGELSEDGPLRVVPYSDTDFD